jgi:hypothetical protein
MPIRVWELVHFNLFFNWVTIVLYILNTSSLSDTWFELFSPTMSFHFLDNVLRSAKIFLLNEIQFIFFSLLIMLLLVLSVHITLDRLSCCCFFFNSILSPLTYKLYHCHVAVINYCQKFRALIPSHTNFLFYSSRSQSPIRDFTELKPSCQ